MNNPITKFISKAPLRLGLAGGGTDVFPYSDNYGGAVLNSAIDLYSTVVIIPREDDKVIIRAKNNGEEHQFEAKKKLKLRDGLDLQIGVYNRIVQDFHQKPLACEIITDIDVPTGSGLGTSSTLVVACIGAFAEWLNLPLGEYDIAQLAVKIERKDLKMAGGKQDQYAATFGGVNFMEFQKENQVIVNPLRIKSEVLRDLEFHLLLFYLKMQRESSDIINIQKSNFEQSREGVLEATHEIKEQAYKMKEVILKNDLTSIAEPFQIGWRNKKKLAKGISNKAINEIYDIAISEGAAGGKISGAGGGGFMMFYCPGKSRFQVIDALKKRGISWQRYRFQQQGLETWKSNQ